MTEISLFLAITSIIAVIVLRLRIDNVNDDRERDKREFKHLIEMLKIDIKQGGTKFTPPKMPDFQSAIDKVLEFTKKSMQSETDTILENQNAENRVIELEKEIEEQKKVNDGLLEMITEKNTRIAEYNILVNYINVSAFSAQSDEQIVKNIKIKLTEFKNQTIK